MLAVGCKKALVAIVPVLTIVLIWATPVSAATKWSVTMKAGGSGEARSSFPAPTGVTGTCVAATEKDITVTWTALAHATSYTVYDSTTSSSSGFAVIVSTVSGLTWTSGSLGADTYWFQVTAHVANWTTADSASSSPRVITNGPGCS